MKYDFDKITDRKGSGCLKYDFAAERGKREDLLPMWVADMDFQTAPAVVERLEKAVRHGIFGYSESTEEYFQAVAGWYRNHFSWEVKKEWIVKTPGVVFALAAAVRAFTKEGDSVLIQQPVYYPFTEVILDNKRNCINSPLRLSEGSYQIDFEDFEKKILKNGVKLFLLCSPHNPVGRVWREDELFRIGEICRKYGVIIVSDEIHSDFTVLGHRHRIFASLSQGFADQSVVCTAPTKTFNLAGLQISNIFIPNPVLRQAFRKEVAAAGYSQVNRMGLAACQAAYEQGGEWLEQLKEYLQGNLAYLRRYLKEKIPEITLIEPEGTYLVWLDFRSLGLTEAERTDLIENRARLWLDSGAMFGTDGEGFERMNIACPRATLSDALDRLKEACHSLHKETGQM